MGTNYKSPNHHDVGGKNLDLNYNSLLERQYTSLLKDADLYGLVLYGDGATVKKIPLINILASGAHLTTAVLDIMDCSKHMCKGGKKDALYIAKCFLPHLKKLDPEMKLVDLFYFDGATNVQKAGKILCEKYPRATTLHGAEHVVSLFFRTLPRSLLSIYSLSSN